MPLYQYHCTNEECDHTSQDTLSMADRHKPSESPCPKCGKLTIVKSVSFGKIVSDTGQLSGKVGDGFREVMSKISDNAPINNLPDFGRGSV